ncbi:MAG: PrsW family glutamic-type intramembrane protease [Patescibacteria group bacterium]
MSFTTIVYAFMASIIPAFIWLSFWLREDSAHPEPRWLIIASFIGGALAVIVAIFGEKYISDTVNDQNMRYTLWAAIEEIIKFAVVIAIALNTKYYDEPIDAMIYIITVALGFAAVENALFILGPLGNGEISQSIATGSMRFIGATLVHIVSSAIIGFFLGYAFYKNIVAKYIYAGIGLAVAIALHASFNLSIINSSASDVLKTFGWIWLAVIILIILFEEVKAVKPKMT